MRNSVLLCIIFAIASCGNDLDQSSLKWGSWSYEHTSSFRIPMPDGVELAAETYIPKQKYFPGKRPAIIFANSWSFGEDQYKRQAKRFAAKGYIVLTYATRGFGGSEGLASGAGPNDIADVSRLIDWLENNTELDSSRIGMAGVSYGGGISLLALANEPRIFTATSMSSWTDIKKSFYENGTLRKFFMELLISTGSIAGNVDPKLTEIYKSFKSQKDIDGALDWAEERSPINYVDSINRRNAPVFISNNYKDFLFPPGHSIEFFDALTTPKRFAMNPGVHGTAELPGFSGLNIGLWKDIHRWYDFWLLGIQNGIMDEPPISLDTPSGMESYGELPEANLLSEELEPVNSLENGSEDGYNGVLLKSSWFSRVSNGIPLLSSFLHTYTPVKVKVWLNKLRKDHRAVYFSATHKNDLEIRGVPQVEIPIIPLSEDIQLVAYLYEVDQDGLGTMITHGVTTFRGVSPGVPFVFDLNLAAIAHNLEVGKKLAVVIDTHDPLYGNLKEKNFSFKLIHSEDLRLGLKLPRK